ncbi:MAG TPA: phasin family protein, partial [Methylibium sp.]|nr:phasin family protein [Methylibium sp.]
QKAFNTAVDSAIKNAPAGTENAAALVKSAVAAANNALESVTKAAKQAQDVAEANFQALNTTAVKATQAATKARR